MADSTTRSDDDPHAQSPTKYYLSYPSRSHTKAVVILMHGRGDNADDMADVFLPGLQRRYGGKESRLDEQSDRGKDYGPVTLVAIEARDHSWYPQSHNAIEPSLAAENERYQQSALDKIRTTLLHLHHECHLPLSSIVLAGFSQGAILSNTYLLSALDLYMSDNAAAAQAQIPLPGYVLAFAGSLFKTPPLYPRPSISSNDTDTASATATAAFAQPNRVRSRLICGLTDQYFPLDEIKDAAGALASRSVGIRHLGHDLDVVVSLALEEGGGHRISPRMIDMVSESVDEILAATAGTDPQNHEASA